MRSVLICLSFPLPAFSTQYGRFPTGLQPLPLTNPAGRTIFCARPVHLHDCMDPRVEVELHDLSRPVSDAKGRTLCTSEPLTM